MHPLNYGENMVRPLAKAGLIKLTRWYGVQVSATQDWETPNRLAIAQDIYRDRHAPHRIWDIVLPLTGEHLRKSKSNA